MTEFELNKPVDHHSDSNQKSTTWTPISFGHLASKELRETLRDRRTIVTLFLMPLLVYPILSLLFQGFLAQDLKTGTAQRSDQFVYVFDSEQDFRKIARILSFGYDELLRAENDDPSQTGTPDGEQGEPKSQLLERHVFQTKLSSESLLWEVVDSGDADVGIEVKIDVDRRGRPANVSLNLIYQQTSTQGRDAAKLIERIINARNNSLLNRHFRQIRVRPFPPTVFAEQVIPPKPEQGISFAALVPLILTLMTITGAVYPAIDLTAGERERGTLESLIAAPIPRMRILLGKLVAIVAVAMLTALVNLAGMMITIWVFRLDTVFFGEQGLTWLTIAQILGLLALFAAFFASVLLVITSFARSFKEGQAYLIPVMLVALAPSLMSLKPDLQLTGIWAITPLVNIVLLSRDVLQGNAVWSTALVTIVATIFYGALAITVAARFFGTANVLYGDSQGIGTLFKRPKEWRPSASASLAMLCLALLFPASFIWQGVLARSVAEQETTETTLAEEDVVTDLAPALDVKQQSMLAAAGIFVVFFCVPYAMSRFHRVRFFSGFRVRATSLVCFAAAVMLGIGLGPLLLQWIELTQFAGEESRSSLVEQAEIQVAKLKTLPIWWVLLCFAVVPAVFEELFFRGMLFQALRGALSPWKTILATAVMFGVFHLITTSGLGISRLVPTTLMGIVLGWVCYRSGSVLPGMILHAIHNAAALSLAYYRDDMIAQGWITADQTQVPPAVLIAGAILTVIGIAILIVRTKKDPRADLDPNLNPDLNPDLDLDR